MKGERKEEQKVGKEERKDEMKLNEREGEERLGMKRKRKNRREEKKKRMEGRKEEWPDTKEEGSKGEQTVGRTRERNKGRKALCITKECKSHQPSSYPPVLL